MGDRADRGLASDPARHAARTGLASWTGAARSCSSATTASAAARGARVLRKRGIHPAPAPARRHRGVVARSRSAGAALLNRNPTEDVMCRHRLALRSAALALVSRRLRHQSGHGQEPALAGQLGAGGTDRPRRISGGAVRVRSLRRRGTLQAYVDSGRAPARQGVAPAESRRGSSRCSTIPRSTPSPCRAATST